MIGQLLRGAKTRYTRIRLFGHARKIIARRENAESRKQKAEGRTTVLSVGAEPGRQSHRILPTCPSADLSTEISA
jgi:hypothetical protein